MEQKIIRTAGKWRRTAQLLRHRITRGDYTIRALPTESELAAELGISRSTARRAMRELMGDGITERRPHGKLEIRLSRPGGSRPRLALLVPAFPSLEFEKWQISLSRVGRSPNTACRRAPALSNHRRGRIYGPASCPSPTAAVGGMGRCSCSRAM